MLCRAAVRRAGVELPRWRAEPSEREKGAGMIILAHAFGARYELPLPLVYFVLGAGIVVLASFALLTRRPVPPAGDAAAADRVPVGPVRPLPGVASLVVLAALVVAGLAGSQERAENIVPTVFWLVLWIAAPLSCGLIGNWTREVNPFAVLARLADSGHARRALLGSPDPVAWPQWLGWWPAVATFFLLVIGELVYSDTATMPWVTALGLLIGALISALMGLLFGAREWLNGGEVFSVLFATWGRLGYFRFGAPGRRGFTGGLDVPMEPVVSRVVFVMMMLVSVTYDGLLATPEWPHVLSGLYDLPGGPAAGVYKLATIAFALLVVIALVVFGALAALIAGSAGRPASPVTALARLAPSLLPIAFGYLFAHNVEYLATNGQLLIPLIGNPVGLPGWQWLPAPFNDSYEVSVPSPASYWYLALAAIIAAHVVAVVVAHRHLGGGTQPRPRTAHPEYQWMAAMVIYTMVSLWLLAQPLAQDKTPPPAAPAASAVLVASAEPRSSP
jgi:hypothetical protein